MVSNPNEILNYSPKEKLEVDRRVIYLVLFGLICGILIVLLANISVNTAAGMRAYVAGEGFWTKAQKSATLSLSTYIFTEDSIHFNKFREDIEVNLQDRIAREELSKEDYDYDIAYNAFLGGKNAPEDIPFMISVFRNYKGLKPVESVIEYWEEGDKMIYDLVDFAQQVDEEIRNGELSSGRKDTLQSLLLVKDEKLTHLESSFSNEVGDLARYVQIILRWSAIILGILLLSVGGIFSIRFKRSAQRWMSSLRSSQEMLANVINNSPDVLYESRLDDMSYEYVSPSIVDLLGYKPGTLTKGGRNFLLEITHPDDVQRLLEEYEILNNSNESGVRSHLEYRVKNQAGDYIWLSSLKTLIIDDEGAAKIIGNVRDISELKEQEAKLVRSLEEKEILIKEVHHRVKNNLAIITSMIELQKAKAGRDSADVLSESQSVINSISKVHEKLYKSTELDRVEMQTYLTELVEELKDTFSTRQRNISFELNLEKIYMLTRPAVSTGLILNELITNAIKYAFEGKEKGVIRIDLKTMDEEILLCVSNDGLRIDAEDLGGSEDSLGMTMISVLVDRLDGTLNINSDEWTEFRILFDKNKSVMAG